MKNIFTLLSLLLLGGCGGQYATEVPIIKARAKNWVDTHAPGSALTCAVWNDYHITATCTVSSKETGIFQLQCNTEGCRKVRGCQFVPREK